MLGGAEWGLHGVALPWNAARTGWGHGTNNTDVLYDLDTTTYSADPNINPGGDTACFPFTPCSPKSMARSISFRTAKDYSGGGFNDWFLPSWNELQTAMWNVGPTMQLVNGFTNPLGTNYGNFGISGNNGQKVYYWTSSATVVPVATWFETGEASLVLSTTGANPWAAYFSNRCHVNRVRAVRTFICADPVPVECSGRSCVDYNFKDGMCMVISGIGVAGYIGHAGMAAYSGYTSQWWGVQATGIIGSDIIGEPVLWLGVPSRDVMGNNITEAMWSDDSLGYTITIWNEDYVYLGKWRYDTFLFNDHSYNIGMGTFNGHNSNMVLDYNKIILTDVVHLDGPNAVVDYSLPGSLTGAYFKIEAAWNSNIPTPFENAINNTPWSNAEFPNDTFLENSPFGCEASANVPPPGSIQSDCLPTFGTHTHYDLSGNVIYVFPDGSTCDTGCGAAVTDPNTGSQSSMAPPNPGNYTYKTVPSKELTGGAFIVDTAPKTGNKKEELTKIRRKKR